MVAEMREPVPDRQCVYTGFFHQGISHWVRCNRVGWGSRNQEWTWHPSKQIGHRWAQDHTGNKWLVLFKSLWAGSLHLVHLVLKLSASVSKQQPDWQKIVHQSKKLLPCGSLNHTKLTWKYCTCINTPLSNTFYDYSPYGLGKAPDCPVTNDWTGFLRHGLKQNIAFFCCSRMKKVKQKTDIVPPWICQIWLENL